MSMRLGTSCLRKQGTIMVVACERVSTVIRLSMGVAE